MNKIKSNRLESTWISKKTAGRWSLEDKQLLYRLYVIEEFDASELVLEFNRTEISIKNQIKELAYLDYKTNGFPSLELSMKYRIKSSIIENIINKNSKVGKKRSVKHKKIQLDYHL